jgi:hypothetical protein
MPRIATFDRKLLADLLKRQYGVLSRDQARACGLAKHVVEYRIRAGGPWQVLLPGVYLTVTGSPNPAQREMAALLYAGPASMITGPAALFRHGVQVAQSQRVDVLVPVRIQRRDHDHVRLHRTTRMPELMHYQGEIRYAPVTRAVVDAARMMNGFGEVRAVVAGAVQRGKCPLAQLAAEASRGPAQGSTHLRQALAEVATGVQSSVEADFRDLIIRVKLPVPMFNASLYAGGQFIARPDCWWPDAGVAAEVDSREWHLSPQDWERTMTRHAVMSSHGIVVLHFSPQQIRKEGVTVAANLRSALAAGRARPPLPIKAVPNA